MSYKLLKLPLTVKQKPGRKRSNPRYFNRRNLIKETWADREGGMNDEIHRSEALRKKIFSSTIWNKFKFSNSYTKGEYLNIVSDMLRREDIQMDENIRSKALTWQIQYNGFSGRTAAQFVSNFLSEQ